MDVVTTVAEVRASVRAPRARGEVVGLVPTMGALHEGHLSLLRRARRECGFVVVTLFVNPTQFGEGEDLARYPRDPAGDRAAAEAHGADLLFSPDIAELYPPGATTWVTVEALTDRFEGAARPGHFRGVATVVAKLFSIVAADRSYFGEKDYQQLLVVRRLARDLHFPVQVVACPTVREADGLALSSRNHYLTAEERRAAAAIPQGLRLAAERFTAGEREAGALEGAAREVMQAAGLRVDYVALADAETLAPLAWADRAAVLLAAARAGATRLIDNVRLPPASG